MNQTTIDRGVYGEIKSSSLDDATRQAVDELIAAASARADEHGSWEFGAEFDNKGRGSAINKDLYAVGNDHHTGGLLIILQIRRYEKAHKNWWPSVRKNYFLVGYNEDGTAFSHPVSSSVVHSAIRREVDPILAAQNWMFNGDYTRMVRQGDLTLVPVKVAAAPALEETEATLEASHVLTADALRQNGHLYALNPTLVHIPGTHPTVSARGWFRVQVGERARYWKFARPSKD